MEVNLTVDQLATVWLCDVMTHSVHEGVWLCVVMTQSVHEEVWLCVVMTHSGHKGVWLCVVMTQSVHKGVWLCVVMTHFGPEEVWLCVLMTQSVHEGVWLRCFTEPLLFFSNTLQIRNLSEIDAQREDISAIKSEKLENCSNNLSWLILKKD